MPSTAALLGLIFAGFLILGGIALAVWYFEFRKPSNAGGPKKCSKDADCSDISQKTQQEQYTGQVCRNGTCQNVACVQSNNQTCATKAPGTTCFGLGPPGKPTDQSCIPMSCRTTDDCAGPGGDAMKENVVCVPDGSRAGQGICVPQKPLDGKGCFNLTNLKPSGNTCIVCDENTPCSKGSYCLDGRCFRCGNSATDNLCEDKKNTEGPAPWGFCKAGGDTDMCSKANPNFKCQTELPSGGSGSKEQIKLPDGSTLESGIGLCLPSEGNCAFSWFNSTAGPEGSSPKPFPGQCGPDAPYCSINGTCEQTPLSNGGAVCGYLPGVGADGKVSTSDGGTYDVTTICSGVLVPKNSYANLANFQIDGSDVPNTSTTCSAGVDNKAPNCTCDPTKSDSNCPEGTYCQPISISNINGRPTTKGICTIIAGTEKSTTLSSNSKPPQSGQLGYYYSNSLCGIPDTGGDVPICRPQPVPAAGSSSIISLNGPGDFCYNTSQCLYAGRVQGPKNTLGALVCNINRCVGGTVAQ